MSPSLRWTSWRVTPGWSAIQRLAGSRGFYEISRIQGSVEFSTTHLTKKVIGSGGPAGAAEG